MSNTLEYIGDYILILALIPTEILLDDKFICCSSCICIPDYSFDILTVCIYKFVILISPGIYFICDFFVI